MAVENYTLTNLWLEPSERGEVPSRINQALAEYEKISKILLGY